MINIASILLAEEGTPFLESTAARLREDGYACDAVAGIAEAAELLASRRYQLFISDTGLDGNGGLELVKEAERLAPGLPAIVVSESPSLETAVEAIGLHVAAYLPKSVPYDDLLGNVRAALARTAHFQAVARVQKQLRRCAAELDDLLRQRWSDLLRNNGATLRIPESTLRGVAGCLAELVAMEAKGGLDGQVARVCELLQCPVWKVHRNAIEKAVALLNETRRRFKSKELGQVRETLEGLLQTLR